MDEFLKEQLFPHNTARDSQKELIRKVAQAVSSKKSLLVHAPTGLGKTAAALSPALAYALKNKLTVFFLTSRHMQHKIVIDTLRKIKELHHADFNVTDIIGKKHMCIISGIESLHSSDFADYCKQARENNQCEFYNNSFKSNKPTPKLAQVIDNMKTDGPLHVEQIIEECRDEKICPYYASAQMAQESAVIVTDYYYLFSENIRNVFFKKAEKTLANSILIVDEGHNLPNRMRELMTQKISVFGIERAIKEAKKNQLEETEARLVGIKKIFERWLADINKVGVSERLVGKYELIEELKRIADVDELIADFEFAASGIREKQKQSSIGAIGKFLELWSGEDDGFTRILSKKYSLGKMNLYLTYRCLDPALLTKTIIGETHSIILMSATLHPIPMYRDILGFDEDSFQETYESPFPKENKLTLVIPETSTKFTGRSEDMYKKIAKICAEITNEIPGNCAIFFPSYDLRNQISKYYSDMCKKTIFNEESLMNKAEKMDFLERFKKYNSAVLLGAAAGSFSEGIDLPGVLKCVIVVGLPLSQPDLETKELIKYYDNQFGKGWDYGYIYPALNKTIQAAGRCIRSETDRGVIVFLDERYAWDNYLKCFPKDWNPKITKLYMDRVKGFFPKQN